ncbi:hypothetical protein IAU60_001828 [Kwoniella sp. DSM 27419]
MRACPTPASFGPGRPDPWAHRKAAILVVLAVLCWSFYVVAARVCAPMLRAQSSSGLGASYGAGFLVGYVILWLLLTWSYLKMITTGPGYARQTRKPEAALTNAPLEVSPQGVEPMRDDPAGPDPSELAPMANIVGDAFRNSGRVSSSTTLANSTGRVGDERNISKDVKDWRSIPRPVPLIITAFGLENVSAGLTTRYVDLRRLVADCHQFFVTFNFWAMLFCAYTTSILIVDAAKSSDVDGQIIALIALFALFGFFTGAMFATHVQLILTGRTTVESFAARDQQEAEDRVLQEHYGYFFHQQARRKVKKRWREEWGDSPVDGRWRWGTKGQLWRQEMGMAPLAWLLPIGRPLGDGVHYAQNPRFGPNGEWLMKRDWPKDIQDKAGASVHHHA